MTITLRSTWLTPVTDRPLLVLGPSLGTSSAQLWRPCARRVADEFSVLAWDLPGHGGSRVTEPFDVADLAAAVLGAVDKEAPRARSFFYAGDSMGGAVGLQLLLDAPTRVPAAVLICTGATIGHPAGWLERAATVRSNGTTAVVAGSLDRWFGARVTAGQPLLLEAFATTLRGVDPEGYAQVCEALATFDLTSRLGEITTPVLAVAGAEDTPTPVSSLAAIADGVLDGHLTVIEDAAHLPPVEAPDLVARLLLEHLGVSEAHA